MVVGGRSGDMLWVEQLISPEDREAAGPCSEVGKGLADDGFEDGDGAVLQERRQFDSGLVELFAGCQGGQAFALSCCVIDCYCRAVFLFDLDIVAE